MQKLPFLLYVFFKLFVDLILPLGLLLRLEACKTRPVRVPADTHSIRDDAISLFREDGPLLIHDEGLQRVDVFEVHDPSSVIFILLVHYVFVYLVEAEWDLLIVIVSSGAHASHWLFPKVACLI